MQDFDRKPVDLWSRSRQRFVRVVERRRRAEETAEPVEEGGALPGRVARVLKHDRALRQRFVEEVGCLVEGLATGWKRGEKAEKARALEAVRKIVDEWPREGHLDSAIVRLLGKTAITGRGDEEQDAGKQILEAWAALETYLDRFGSFPWKQTLIRAGVDPRAVLLRVRDAAWREREYQLALRLNRPLMEPVFWGSVAKATDEAWFNHLHILEAMGKWHGVAAQVERVKALCKTHGREHRLDELAEWEEKCRARGVAAGPAAPAAAQTAEGAPKPERAPPALTLRLRGRAGRIEVSATGAEDPTLDRAPLQKAALVCTYAYGMLPVAELGHMAEMVVRKSGRKAPGPKSNLAKAPLPRGLTTASKRLSVARESKRATQDIVRKTAERAEKIAGQPVLNLTADDVRWIAPLDRVQVTVEREKHTVTNAAPTEGAAFLKGFGIEQLTHTLLGFETPTRKAGRPKGRTVQPPRSGRADPESAPADGFSDRFEAKDPNAR